MAPFTALLNHEIITNKSGNWAGRPVLSALMCIQTYETLMEMNDDMIQFQVLPLLGKENPFKYNCPIVNICLEFNNFI